MSAAVRLPYKAELMRSVPQIALEVWHSIMVEGRTIC